MVFSHYAGFGAQVDSTAVAQLTNSELQGALAALVAGQGYPARGATAADVAASANLLIAEANKRGLPLPSGRGQGVEERATMPGTGSTSSASSDAPPKSNTALIIGGVAVVAAIFLLKK